MNVAPDRPRIGPIASTRSMVCDAPAARSFLAALVVGAAALGGASCKGEEQRAAPPPPAPPAAAAKPGVCQGGGGQLADPATAAIFPRASGGFCLDPNAKEKTFGDEGALPLDRICDLFDGECEIYKGFNVRRVVEVRYVDGAGSPATIDIHLSKFGTSEGAYAMFTKRVVGDGDPADEATPRPIEGGGAAGLGLGNAYLWRGQHLAEITYNDESASEAGIKAAGEKLLPPLVREIGAKLPGQPEPPPAVAALPAEGRLPNGIRYFTTDVLGIEGVGHGAVGYYRDGERRYRMIALVRNDADQALDVLTTFGKVAGASKEKGIGDGAVRLMHQDGEGESAEWIVAHRGKLVVGIGDEVLVLRRGMSADERAKLTLDKNGKLDRLKKALGG